MMMMMMVMVVKLMMMMIMFMFMMVMMMMIFMMMTMLLLLVLMIRMAKINMYGLTLRHLNVLERRTDGYRQIKIDTTQRLCKGGTKETGDKGNSRIKPHCSKEHQPIGAAAQKMIRRE